MQAAQTPPSPTFQKHCFLYPGQGSQILGMAKDFYDNFSSTRATFEEASDVTHLNLKKLCFDGPLDALTLTENLQPALLTVCTAITRVIASETALKADYVAGHSAGEYAALVAGSVLDFGDAIRLIHARGLAMQTAVPAGKGGMAAIINGAAPTIESLCREVSGAYQPENLDSPFVAVANYNNPQQIVIAGTIIGLDLFEQRLNQLKESAAYKNMKCMRLKVSAPFHCQLMAAAQQDVLPKIAKTRFQLTNVKVIPNVTAQPTQNPSEIQSLLVDQITAPVQWTRTIENLNQVDSLLAVEVGPSKVLSNLVKRHEGITLPTTSIGQVSDLARFQK